jgi:3-dehydroquinate dehydratase/shikimate dehydrogenase
LSFNNETRICVPLNEDTLSGLTAATVRAADNADLIELRLDGLQPQELRDVSTKLKNLINSISRPVILTLRSSEEGGYRPLTKTQRQTFWQEYVESNAALFDIELDLVTELTNSDGDDQPDWSRVICSRHYFHEAPNQLEDVYEQMAFTPARILKLAINANDIVDCIDLFKLLERADREQRDLIAIAMGDAGVITRILGPSRGSFLTYGAAEVEKGTAPGQILASELRAVYRIDKIDRDTVVTGLVGLPVVHSVSPHMHNAAFQASGLNGVYLPLEVHDLDGFFRRMVVARTREFEWNLRGLSITAPHKVGVMKFLDWMDPVAQEIGAVNTIVLQDERLLGYNTDADGFIEPLTQRIGSLSGVRAAVIGAGGAASAAVFALQQHNVDVRLFARSPANAETISRRFNISCESLGNVSFGGNDIVINATPLGSIGEKVNETPATAQQLRGSRLVYDLVYNPIETRFMREGNEAGCDVLGGLEMLVAQARRQFKLMTNTDISSELMYAAGSSALARNFSSSS